MVLTMTKPQPFIYQIYNRCYSQPENFIHDAFCLYCCYGSADSTPLIPFIGSNFQFQIKLIIELRIKVSLVLGFN